MPFVTAGNLEEVFDRLDQGALPVAGGTDLFVRLRREGGDADLVGLERISGFDRITFSGNCLSIGAAVTWQRILDSSLVAEKAPLLALAARPVGGPAIRHMGTLGGNVCTASPAGDGLVALFALEASVRLVSRAGERSLPVEDFVAGPGATVLKKGEILAALHVPLSEIPGLAWFYKAGLRKALAISVGSLALSWCIEEGRMRDVRLAFGSMGPVPLRLPEAEALLEGALPEAELFRQAGEICRLNVKPISDLRASELHRRRLAAGFVEKWGLGVLRERNDTHLEGGR